MAEGGEGSPQATFVRVEYDVERAMRGIRMSDLPGEFAEDLRTGRSQAPATEYTTTEPEG